MGSPGGPGKVFIPTAPDKGSFPLDREGVCKKSLTDYLTCLARNNHKTEPCREQVKEYLQCRMDNGLMDREELSKLGFKDDTSKSVRKS